MVELYWLDSMRGVAMKRIGWVHIIFLYLGVMLVFAWVYSWVAGDFYHPYVKFEPIVRDLRAQFQRQLAVAINNEFKKNPDLGDGVTFQLAYGAAIQGQQDEVLQGSIELSATLNNDKGQQMFTSRLPILIAPLGLRAVEKKRGLIGLPPGTKVPGFDVGGELGTVYLAQDPQRLSQDETIMPHSSEDQALVTQALGKALERIQLSPTQKTHTAALVRTEQGFPAFVEGTFGRMLYFSAVTITTVGYGDVVPLTGLSRSLAALEATLGIVLLGLFVSRLV